MPSTVIEHIDYNDDEQELIILFRSGIIYKYYDVPLSIFVDFKKSGSKGTFLNQVIKGNFKYKKIG